MPMENCQLSTNRDLAESKQKNSSAVQLWYVYFDSLFTKKFVCPTRVVLELLLHFQDTPEEWTVPEPLPELAKGYAALQHFLTERDSWLNCNTVPAELQRIEKRLNQISILLQMEKQYGQDFWARSTRRIQASVCHLYMLFQATMEALLLGENQTLSGNQQQKKLCTNLSFIQNLVNKLLQDVSKIYSFMISAEFSQERKLTLEFFNHINKMFKTLPRLKKSELTHIPKLLQFVQIINPIELSKSDIISDSAPEIRRRAGTVGSRPKQNRFSSQNNDSRRNLFKDFNGTLYYIKVRSISVDNSKCYQHSKKEPIPPPVLFQFPKYIKKYATYYEEQFYGLTRKRSDPVHPRVNRMNSTSSGRSLRSKRFSLSTYCNSETRGRKNSELRKYMNTLSDQIQEAERADKERHCDRLRYQVEVGTERIASSMQKKKHTISLDSGTKICRNKLNNANGSNEYQAIERIIFG